jgi:tetratricopeptide (TPR) repeat protein
VSGKRLLAAGFALLCAAGLGLYVRTRLHQGVPPSPGTLSRASEGVWEASLRSVINSFEQSPDDVEVQNQLLGSLWVLGQLEPLRAAEVAERSARIPRAGGRLWAAAARHYAAAGQVRSATRAAEHAARSGNLDASAALGVGWAFYAAGSYRRALPYLRAACTPHVREPRRALWLLIRASRLAGRPDQAVARIEETVRAGWSDNVPRNAIVQAYVSAGRWDDALSAAEELARQDDLDGLAACAASFAAASRDVVADAERYLGLVEPVTRPSPLLMRAVVEAKKARYEEALTYVRWVLWETIGPLVPEKPPPLVVASRFLDEPAAPDMHDIWRLLAQCTSETDALHALLVRGCAQDRLGKTEEAHSAFAEAAKTQPNIEPARTYLEERTLKRWVSMEALGRG